MALTFYYGSGSPFGWRVFLALEYKALPYTLRTLSFSARETQQPEFLRINPRGKIPAIVDDDFALYESAAILEYLDERFPEAPRLFPAGLRERAIVRRLVRELDEYLGDPVDRLALEIYFKPPEQWDAALVATARDEAAAELRRLEGMIAGPFLAGELSAADFTLYPVLATCVRFERKKPDVGLKAAFGPKLTGIAKAIQALPYYDKTYPSHWR